jgi:hypothetical protein
MSAFVMLSEGFSQLATELACRAEHSNNVCDLNYSVARDVRQFLGLGDYASDAFETAQKVTGELYAANVRAVGQRYNDSSEPETVNITRTGFWPQWSPYQLLKHLTCLNYQMSEGDVPQSEIYKRLEKLIYSIALSIACESPEYDQAAWDFKPIAKAA